MEYSISQFIQMNKINKNINNYTIINLCYNFISYRNMELKEIISKRLKETRIKNNLSQADVAGELNITQAAIAQYEAGKSMPSPEILFWYAKRFNTSLDYLFGLTDDPRGSANYDFAKPGTDANKLLREVVKTVVDEVKNKK